MKHSTGWESVVYGEAEWHRTLDAAEHRVAKAYNGMGCPPDGVWCCVTGTQAHECDCPQCADRWRPDPTYQAGYAYASGYYD